MSSRLAIFSFPRLVNKKIAKETKYADPDTDRRKPDYIALALDIIEMYKYVWYEYDTMR